MRLDQRAEHGDRSASERAPDEANGQATGVTPLLAKVPAAAASSSSSGCVERRRRARGSGPGVTPWTASTREAGRAASSSSSRAVKQVVQRSNSRSSPSASRTVATLVQHAGRGIERLAVLEEPDGERSTRTRVSASRPPGRSARGDPAEHVDLVAPAEQPEAALAQADHGVELAVERELAHVEHLEASPASALGRRRVTGERDEVGRVVDADDVDARAGRARARGARARSRRRAPAARLEPERVDEEVDLLLGPLRERVAQVRRPEERRDRVEPRPSESPGHRRATTSWDECVVDGLMHEVREGSEARERVASRSKLRSGAASGRTIVVST